MRHIRRFNESFEKPGPSIEGVYIDGQFDNTILESILSNYR
jgi:hypothetical protein